MNELDASFQENSAAAVATFSPSTGSASRYSVPIPFLWAADALTQVLAVASAWWLTPVLKNALLSPNAPWSNWIAWTSPSALSLPVDAARFPQLAWVILVTIPVTVVYMQLLGGYRPLLDQSRTRVAMTSMMVPILGLSHAGVVLLALHSLAPSRIFLFSYTVLCGIGFLACRTVVRSYKRRRMLAGRYARSVVVVATGPTRRWLAAHFKRNVPPELYTLQGYLEIECDSDVPDEEDQTDRNCAESLRRLGRVDDIGELMVHHSIDEILVVPAATAETWMPTLIDQCEYFRVTLRVVPASLVTWQSTSSQPMLPRGVLRLPEYVITPRHLDSEALFAKRIVDIGLSGASLLLLSPLFLVIAAAIKLTTPRLSVFYPWKVIGYQGRAFTGYKFTTMVADADAQKASLGDLNEMSGPVFKIKNDPRVTSLGRFLRKYSLNELPQFWSVLKGDMSLVGPRPAGPHELRRYQMWHKRKLCVQPGMTCLWQVRGRNAISDFDEWVRMDFEYIDNWSLWLDAKILARTCWAVAKGTGS